MASVLTVGISTFDLIFAVSDFPATAGKHRASALTQTGGGNAANAATAISRLGGSAFLLSCCGSDPMGNLIIEELKRDGVNLDYFKQISGCPSPVSAIFANKDGERLIMNHRAAGLIENFGPLTTSAFDRVDATLADTRWVSAAHIALSAAKEKGKPAILDFELNREGSYESLLQAANYVICEAESLFAYSGRETLNEALDFLAQMTDAKLAATDGAKGCYMRDQRGDIIHIPAYKVNVVDSTGAGDAFHGAAALALAEGQDFQSALRFGSAVAAKKCEALGARAGLPDRETVEKILETY